MTGESAAVQSGERTSSVALARLMGQLSTAVADRMGQQKTANSGGTMDVLEWGRNYLANYFRRTPSKMHIWLGNRLDGLQEVRGSKINAIGPRGGAKSTIASLCYVLQCAVEGWEPYIWIVSDTQNQAKAHLENVRHELEENQCLIADYPRACGRGPRWRATSLQLNNGTVIECFGTGQRIRGRRRKSNRPTLIVCDDLQNDGHMTSSAQREASRQWFDGTLLKAGTKHTNVVNLATALHREALAMQLHETAGWQSQKFMAIETWPSNQQLWSDWEGIYCNVENPQAAQHAALFYATHRQAMDEGSVLLWPEEEDLYTLMKMRVEAGQTAFAREKQSSPIDSERCEWPESYFDDHIWFDSWPEDLQLKTMALDPSKGKDSRLGDYSAFAILGVDRKGTLFVQADLARRPTPQMVADGVDLFGHHSVQSFGVEANVYQELLAGEFLSEFRRREISGIAPFAIHNHVNKQTRIRRLGPYLSQRRLRFRSGCSSTLLLVNQLRDFPLGSHDDGPDALEMALRLAEQVFAGQDVDDGLGNCLKVGD
ncbi:MAG: hypothetical protein AAGD11_03005 [Planctomycetota bacterium]